MKKTITAIGVFFSSFVFAQMDNALIGYWPLDGNSQDYSGNGLSGNLSSVPTTTDRNNKVGCACFALSEPIVLPSSRLLDIGPNDSMTVSLWYKGGSKEQDDLEIIFGKYAGTGLTKNYYLGLYDLNRPVAGRPYPNFTEDFYEGDTTNWHHQVMTYKKGEWRMYYDGKEYGKYWIDTTITLDSTINIMIGNSFRGAIDDVRFYRDDLDSSGIAALNQLPSSCAIVTSLSQGETESAEKKYMVRAVNLLGQDINDLHAHSGPAILFYSDGSRRKTIK